MDMLLERPAGLEPMRPVEKKQLNGLSTGHSTWHKPLGGITQGVVVWTSTADTASRLR